MRFPFSGCLKLNIPHPDEEVDHEENIECQVDLLGCVLRPGNAGLHCVTKIN